MYDDSYNFNKLVGMRIKNNMLMISFGILNSSINQLFLLKFMVHCLPCLHNYFNFSKIYFQ